MNTENSSTDSAFRSGAASDQDESLNATGASTNPETRSYTEQAKDALSSGQNAVADAIDRNTNTTSSTTGGSFIEDIKNKMSGGNIGGNQLFDKADNSHEEGQAASGLLHKYTDEIAPGESST